MKRNEGRKSLGKVLLFSYSFNEAPSEKFKPPSSLSYLNLLFPSSNLLPLFPQRNIIVQKGLLPSLQRKVLMETRLLQLPPPAKLITDCAKLRVLDELLTNLKKDKHRCLIFCQMTKMLDILEDYFVYRNHTYLRMDGSSTIPDRRDMVYEFQNNPNVFCFLLSTRAGGLGVTLTGADTVIFYDNDWNPTMVKK